MGNMIGDAFNFAAIYSDGEIKLEELNEEFSVDGQPCVTPDGIPFKDWRIVLEVGNRWTDVGIQPMPIPTFGVC
jgi:hypothetical protein